MCVYEYNPLFHTSHSAALPLWLQLNIVYGKNLETLFGLMMELIQNSGYEVYS